MKILFQIVWILGLLAIDCATLLTAGHYLLDCFGIVLTKDTVAQTVTWKMLGQLIFIGCAAFSVQCLVHVFITKPLLLYMDKE